MNTEIIILTIIIVLLLIIIFIVIRYDDNSKREKITNLLSKSSGVYDKHAHEAVQVLNNIERPTPVDNFITGNILRFNILGDDVTTSVGRVLRREIREQYRNTLQNLVDDIRNYEDENHIPIAVMLDGIGEFLHIDPDQEERTVFINLFNETLPYIQKNTIQDKRDRAAAVSNNPIEFVSNYIDENITHTTQPQNTHDSSVIKDLKQSLIKLKSTYPKTASPDESIKAAEQFIKSSTLSSDIKSKALSTLETISKSNYISTYNENEDNIFSYVWERTNHDLNSGSANLLKEAVIISLADCIENNNQVCINGRTSRYLNSLVTLDYDPDMSHALTSEEYRNEIFDKVRQIIDKNILMADKSTDMKPIADYYNGNFDIHVDEDIKKKFLDLVELDIDNIINEYKDKFHDHQISTIRQDCLAAINY